MRFSYLLELSGLSACADSSPVVSLETPEGGRGVSRERRLGMSQLLVLLFKKIIPVSV